MSVTSCWGRAPLHDSSLYWGHSQKEPEDLWPLSVTERNLFLSFKLFPIWRPAVCTQTQSSKKERVGGSNVSENDILEISINLNVYDHKIKALMILVNRSNHFRNTLPSKVRVSYIYNHHPNKINTFIQQGCITFIKSEILMLYNATQDFHSNKGNFFWTFYSSRNGLTSWTSNQHIEWFWRIMTRVMIAENSALPSQE